MNQIAFSNNKLMASPLDGGKEGLNELQQFFSNTTDQEHYGQFISQGTGGSNYSPERFKMQQLPHNGLASLNGNYKSVNTENLVNASELDAWVKKADEFRELYARTEM